MFGQKCHNCNSFVDNPSCCRKCGALFGYKLKAEVIIPPIEKQIISQSESVIEERIVWFMEIDSMSLLQQELLKKHYALKSVELCEFWFHFFIYRICIENLNFDPEIGRNISSLYDVKINLPNCDLKIIKNTSLKRNSCKIEYERIYD